MIKVLYIILISLFSLTFISCGEKEESTDSTATENTTTSPPVTSTSPSDSDSSVEVTTSISVTFSEPMKTSSINLNPVNNCLTGTFLVSSDNFTTCVVMSAIPSVSNSNKTFTVTPSSSLPDGTNYKIRVSTGVIASSGKTFSSDYEMTNGFTTKYPSYVAVGGSGNIFTSTDAITWTSRTSGTTYSLNGITYGNSIFLAVGGSGNSNGVILTSSDGVTWSAQSKSGGNHVYRATTFGNSTFIIVGKNGKILKSSDGSNWTDVSISSRDLLDVTYGNMFVAVSELSKLYTSSDGSSWTTVDISSGPSGDVNYYGVAFGNNTYVAVGSSGKIYSSSDGSSWTSRSSGITGTLNDIAYGNSVFVVVGSSGKIITSSDGSSWTERTSGTSMDLDTITYGDEKFIVSQSMGTSALISSTDGINWSSTGSAVNDFDDIVYTSK